MTFFKKPLACAAVASLCVGVSACAEERENIETAVLYVAADPTETTALAGFYGDIFGINRCATEVVDRCEIATCLDGGAVRTYVDGGLVDFTGTDLDVTLDTGKVTDDDGNVGPGFARGEALPMLTDNQEITMKVHGKGSVSTVEGSVTMPVRLTVSEPALVEPSCQTVDPTTVEAIPVSGDQDFSVKWSSSELDDVDVLFFFDEIANYTGDPERERFTSIRCLYTADEELAEIPEEVVAHMPTGVRGTFSIRQIVSNAKLVSNWAITFGGYWEQCSPVEVN